MTRTRILFPILGFLFAIGFVCAAAFLPWIPEWYTFQTIAGFVGVLGGLVAGILLVRGIWLQTAASMKVQFRILLAGASGLVMAAVLYFAFMITALSADGGFMGPEFVRKFEFPEYGTTIYVYDDGFFDAQALFRTKPNALPFAWDVIRIPDWDTEHTEFEQEGEWAVCENLRIHLPTGEVHLR
jgi:hypothetical protein